MRRFPLLPMMALAELPWCASFADRPAADAAAVPGSAEQIRPLLVGAAIPAVTLTTPEGEPFELVPVVSKGPTILIFYRGGW